MRKNDGFLLFEVVLSIAIISLGAAVILRSFVSSARANATAEDMLKGTYLLEDEFAKLEMVPKQEIMPQEGETDDGRFSWKSDVDIYDEDLGIVAVKLDTEWKKGGRNNHIALETFFQLAEKEE